MTDYRDILASEVAVDAPLTQQLIQALKDNPLAIQEGDSTAVAQGKVIQHGALEGHDQPITAGDNVIYEDTINPGTSVNGRTSSIVKIRKAGTYRLSAFCETRGSDGSDDDADFSLFRKPSGGSNARITSSTRTAISGTSSISSGLLTLDNDSVALVQVDIALSVGDEVNAEIDDIGTRADPAIMKFQICVSDDNAMYGVDVIPQRKTAI